ncbi:MAG: RNase adapter RapZ [Ruminococcus sp.]|nr:RNase adapter RapZ [Ruminococcus sp.]
MKFLIVTGMSGSGKSTAVNVLEDMGYYCIDNIPPELIIKFAELCSKSAESIDKAAFVVDVRGGDFFLKLQDAVTALRAHDVSTKVLFLESFDDVIARRYKETRRKHPLDEMADGSLTRAIQLERGLLMSAKAMSDYYIDTSNYSVSDFRSRLYSMFEESEEEHMNIDVRSFGFKYGVFAEGDLIFDVRCLPNPFYVPELKSLTGLNKEVSDYVMSFDEAKLLSGKLFDLVDFLIPLYEKEGKSQLVIAFGCTGGKHRSVTFAQLMAEHLERCGHRVRVSHRDIKK